MNHFTHLHGCEGSLILMVESGANIRKMLPISATLPPSSVLSRARKTSEQLQSSSCLQLILTQFWGKLKVFSLLPRGTPRRWILEKTQTHQPLAAGVQIHASSEAELQEGRYRLLLPLGNTGDRLKSKGKKVISQLVCPEQEKVPDTNKLINAESSWGQAFPSPPLFFWFFLTG